MTPRRAWLGHALAFGAGLGLWRVTSAQARSKGAVYLTFDTGHMGVAPLVARVLRDEGVVASFFLANEPTLEGGASLDDAWAPWWRARAAEGHDFGSHTWDHAIWEADLPDGRMRFRLQAGRQSPRRVVLDERGYAEQLERSAERFQAMTGQRMSRLFRAPAGRTSPRQLAAAAAAGWTHVGWTPHGFLGDELNSDTHPNAALLARALRHVREGDVLLAHLGIWQRRDPWAPAVLQPLLQGLRERGLRFAPLREHPVFGARMMRP